MAFNPENKSNNIEAYPSKLKKIALTLETEGTRWPGNKVEVFKFSEDFLERLKNIQTVLEKNKEFDVDYIIVTDRQAKRLSNPSQGSGHSPIQIKISTHLSSVDRHVEDSPNGYFCYISSLGEEPRDTLSANCHLDRKTFQPIFDSYDTENKTLNS